MAYSGLPSKACANCRMRRIKCNLLEPACSQCRRAGKECPGYRDELSLIFRDENSKVIRKAHGRAHAPERQTTRHGEKRSQTHADETPNTNFGDSGLPWTASPTTKTSSPKSDLSLRTISSPLEEQGVNFFFHHYLASCMPAQRAPLDVSTWPFWQNVSVHKPCLDAVSSVGLAGLANVKNSQQLMRVARLKHASTLHRVANALPNLTSADLPYTLRAIMMLALFEIVNYNPESAGSWKVHVGGAIAIINSNHFRQFHEEAEVRTKIQFCFSIYINCIDTGDRLPPPIAVWSRMWGASLSQQDAPAGSLVDIILQYVELCASISSGALSTPTTIFQKALQLEIALAKWKQNLPAFWNYTVAVAPGKSEAAFNGKCHIYEDFWIERMWDHYRWLRILVNELLLTNSDSPSSPPDQTFQQAEALQLIHQLASDICTSVATVLYRLAPLPGAGSFPPRVGSIFMIIWTLRTAGGAIGVPDALHDWVVRLLENIGQTMGILQTRVAISKSREHREHWKRQFSFRFDGALDGDARDVDALSDFADLH